MSHFNVAVFTRDHMTVHELLAPYEEVFEEDSPYTEFVEDEDDNESYWRNPNAKWDWYDIGGRWKNMLRTKYGKRVNVELVSNCDFKPDKAAYDYAVRFWEINVEGKPKAEDDTNDYFNLYKPEYYTELYGTKENYAENSARFSTFAFVDADGGWHEQGEMGFWGLSTTNRDSLAAYLDEFDAYLKKAEAEGLYIVIVDCHI